VCRCAGLGAGGPTWSCGTCPGGEPTTGDTCPSRGLVCVFGSDSCSCLASGWQCGTCPSTLPTDGSACSTANLDCTYDQTSCLCTNAINGPDWRCNVPCPANEPAPGDACSTGAAQQCVYGAATCVCVNGQFFCN